MRDEEKALFKELCNFKNKTFNEEHLVYASPQVLGMLFFNRMQGIAYDRMRRHDVLGKVNREFRNSLKNAYEQNVEKNRGYMSSLDYLSRILTKSKCKVAMLKGAYLCSHYPVGCRTSNDVDILVSPDDVTAVGKILSDEGFSQGYIRYDKFVPASRKEVIESKMMRGETVPYIKEVNLPYMRYLEVDINFSLDYKNSENDMVSIMLDNSVVADIGDIKIPTLEKADFFIHLCAHLYKEATTMPWIKMHRDMTLYKYADIYLLLSEMNAGETVRIFDKAAGIGMAEICAYCILETADLFDVNNINAVITAQYVLANNPDFRLRVISPRDNKIYNYKTKNASERFFMENRIEDLTEVNDNEKT